MGPNNTAGISARQYPAFLHRPIRRTNIARMPSTPDTPKRRRKALTAEERATCERLRAVWERRSRELGLTQESVANEWDMTQGAVSAYLVGRNPLGVEAALRFAAALQVDVAEISPHAARLARAALRQQPIGELIASLPDDAPEMSLDFLGLQMERNRPWFTAEQFTHYMTMIDRFRTDMHALRRKPDAKPPPKPFDDQPGSSLDWRD